MPHMVRMFLVFLLFFFVFFMTLCISHSKPEHPRRAKPGQFFDGQIPTPGKKELKTSTPGPIKTS